MTDAPTLEEHSPDAPRAARPAGGPRLDNRRVAFLTFAAYVAIALPLILLWLGSYHWFLRDDWFFIAGRNASLRDLFEPGNAHWSTLPLLVYRALWSVFGLHSYVPYQALSVTAHLTAAVLLRIVMRRAGVRPWIATCAAAMFVLFGPGEANITWAFQIGPVGSLCFGLVQLILADHDHGIDRRDWLGLGAGVLALMCSGIGTTMAFTVGVSTLLRRGWRVAAFHTVPLAAVYLTYVAVEHPDLNTYGRPPAGVLWDWVRSAVWSGFESLGHFTIVGVVLVAVLVVGTVVATQDNSVAKLRRRATPTAALFLGGIVFALTTGYGRWGLGTEGATASRYVYLAAAFTLPAIAYAAEAITRRWNVSFVPLVILLLLPIPWNASTFGTGAFDAAFFRSEKRILTTAPRVPFASDVPRDVHPINDPFLDDVTIGFLLDAQRAGKLPANDSPIPPAQLNELKVRLGLSQHDDQAPPTDCRTVEGSLDISPAKGTALGIKSPVAVTNRDRADRGSSPPVRYLPANGRTLRVELDGLDLHIAPVPGASEIVICQ